MTPASLVKIATALACMLMLATAPAALAAKRTVPQGFMGINWDSSIAQAPDDVQDAQFPQMAAAGVETLRAAFSWAQAQPERKGPINLERSDRLMEMASARHIAVLPEVIIAPRWGRTMDAAMSPPYDPFDFRPYVEALVRRYGPRGSFWSDHPTLPRMPIHYWQFWNEPHLAYQWTLPPGETDWAPGYRDQLAVFYYSVKTPDPTAKVVLAGLSNYSWNYLKELYKAGARRYFDIAALHPYTDTPTRVMVLVHRFRKVMREHGDEHKQLWVTEMGLPASQGTRHSKKGLQTTPKGMARFLKGSVAALARTLHKKHNHVSRVFWYTWASEYTGELFRYTGLMRYPNDGPSAPQPAYGAYRGIARTLEGCAKSDVGACR